jgi:prepilin-type N-terminal cleavage/methylation domain-containing protein
MKKIIQSFNIHNPVKKAGFTIVEIIIVITVIGVLATILAVNYNGWQQSLVVAQLKSDLNSAVAAMNTARNFGNSGYPTDVTSLSTFKPSEGVTLFGGGSDGGQNYCIDAASSKLPGTYYYVSSANSLGIQVGACPPTGGVITYSDGYTIHTFTSNGIFKAGRVGRNVYIDISGAGGGGGGGGDGDSTGGGPGGDTSLTNISNSITYIANGGGGSAGGASTPGGFVNTASPIVGGGSAGGAGGDGIWCDSGGNGANGGRIVGSLNLSSSQSFQINIGAGGAGGYGDSYQNDCSDYGNPDGDSGAPGVVTIKYLTN